MEIKGMCGLARSIIPAGESETIQQPFKYVGQLGVQAEDNGLYYMRARYYDAEVGIFISEDPIGFAGGLNLYAYVGGNPIGSADPSGLVDLRNLGFGVIDFTLSTGEAVAGLGIAIQKAILETSRPGLFEGVGGLIGGRSGSKIGAVADLFLGIRPAAIASGGLNKINDVYDLANGMNAMDGAFSNRKSKPTE